MLHCLGRGQLLLSTLGLVFTIVCTKKILTPFASETHIFMTVIGTVMRPRTIRKPLAAALITFRMCLSISCVNIQSETSIFQKKTSFYRLAESQFHIKTFTKLYRFCDAFFFYCVSLCIFEVKIQCVTQSIYRTPHTRTAREAMKIKRGSKLLGSAYAANKSTLYITCFAEQLNSSVSNMTMESIGNNAFFLYHVTQRLRDSYRRIEMDALWSLQ